MINDKRTAWTDGNNDGFMTAEEIKKISDSISAKVKAEIEKQFDVIKPKNEEIIESGTKIHEMAEADDSFLRKHISVYYPDKKYWDVRDLIMVENGDLIDANTGKEINVNVPKEIYVPFNYACIALSIAYKHAI